MEYVTNEHGVEGYWSNSGSHFGHEVTDSSGLTRFQACVPIFVPRVCRECRNFDVGEYGEYGGLLSGPYCIANVWFPTRKGTCKKAEPYQQTPTTPLSQTGVARHAARAHDTEKAPSRR